MPTRTSPPATCTTCPNARPARALPQPASAARTCRARTSRIDHRSPGRRRGMRPASAARAMQPGAPWHLPTRPPRPSPRAAMAPRCDRAAPRSPWQRRRPLSQVRAASAAATSQPVTSVRIMRVRQHERADRRDREIGSPIAFVATVCRLGILRRKCRATLLGGAGMSSLRFSAVLCSSAS